MTSAFSDLFIVDADSHWSEPADLFTRDAPASLKDRLPHHETIDGVRTWVMDGVPIGFAGAGAVIGRDGTKSPSHEALWDWVVEDAHVGAYDPKERLKVLDECGIDAQIIFPSSIGLGGQELNKIPDQDLSRLAIEIYNDRMAQVQEESGNRLLPLPLMPAWDVDLCIAEAKRVAAMGARGVNMTSDPDDSGAPDLANPAWDPFWETVAVLNKVFTPRAIQAQKQTVTEKIEKYLSGVDPDGFDTVDDFAGPFPVQAITTMLGAPDEDAQQVRHWIDASLTHVIGQFELTEEGTQAAIDTAMYYYGLVEQRRATPKDDLLSQLLAAELTREDGQKTQLTDLEIAAFATLLGGAGAETVTKLVGNAVYLFAKHPEQWQKLLDDRSKIPAAVEELLRCQPPVHYNMRVATKEVQLHGQTIPEGAPVFLICASANRDHLAWSNANTFDIDRDRTEAQNLGFGYSIHSCLGAALARMESAIALEMLLDFMPRYGVGFDRCERVQMPGPALVACQG